MCIQINMHSTINYLIYITCREITKYNTNLSALRHIQTWRLTDWSFYRSSALRKNHTHKRLSFNFTLCSEFSLSLFFSPRVLLSIVSNLIYSLLLLFIGNLKIDSRWIYRLAINGYNNYLPTNLASEINSTCLYCRIVDSSLLWD